MVLAELKAVLPKVVDPRPGKADPIERAKRKAHEKEHNIFALQEFALKAGVLATMGALALYPWEKKYEAHVEKHHPEKQEEEKHGKAREKTQRDGRADERRVDSERDRRRRGPQQMSEERVRRSRTAPVFEERRRRNSVGPMNMRLAVADGFEYVSPHRGYTEDPGYRRSVDAESDRRRRRESADEYVFRPRRDSRR